MDFHAKNKVIMHIDGDAFFVAVEIAKNPKLRGLPVVTGEERGIVSALSYEAKALGVTRGMPIFRLRRQYPQVIVMPGDYRSYVDYSGRMFDIVRRYVDIVEEYSIDECFADLTGLDRTLKLSYRTIAERIKAEIIAELGLSVSIGIGPAKVLAKVASKWHKPNGLTIIPSAEPVAIEDFLREIPISKIWGIGGQTSLFLKKQGIVTALHLYERDRIWISEYLAKPHQVIWYELHGMSIMQVDAAPRTTYHSIQKTRSFHPATNDLVFLSAQLMKHIEDACTKARHYDLVAQSVGIFFKTKNFEYHTYAFDLEVPTNAPVIITALVMQHIHRIHHRHVQYRTTGVTLQGLVSRESVHIQGDLFGGVLDTDVARRSEKYELIHQEIDRLEQKFGRDIVHLGSAHHRLSPGKGAKMQETESDMLDRDLLFL